MVYGAPTPVTAELEQALAAQTVGPARIERRASFVSALEATAGGHQDWLWLLDGWTIPAPGALGALLDAAAAVPGTRPLLLASRVLDSQGDLHPDGIPRHEILEKQHSIDAAEHHLVQLRSAVHGSVLIAMEAVERFGAPRSDLPFGLDMVEFSARILQRWTDVGYLVPDSDAVRKAPSRKPSRQAWLNRARLLGSSAWTPTERLWEAFLLGQSAGGVIRRPRQEEAASQGRDGVGTPGASPSRSPRAMTGSVRAAK